MFSPLEEAYLKYPEPIQGCLLGVRELLLQLDPRLDESLKWGMPFFTYQKKVCCYLWVDKKKKWPYIGWMDGRDMQHPALVKGERKRIQILWLDPNADLPQEDIAEVLIMAMKLLEQ